MCLTQGLMSAISAGMLIYAATVEMLAGDFVFGDLADSQAGHGHVAVGEGGVGNSDTLTSTDTSFSLGGQGGKGEEGGDGGVWRQVVAVVSLLAGIGAMGLVGLGE
jgi:hypothetical protein